MSVYKIIDNTNGDVYIGSSTNTKNRFYRHVHFNFGKNVTANKIINNGNYTFVILENNIEKPLLLKREQYYMDLIPNINKCKAYRTLQQQREYNKNDIKERKKYWKTWGGDKRYHNNLLCIDLDIFN